MSEEDAIDQTINSAGWWQPIFTFIYRMALP
jgi:hypothetical protein